MTKHSDGPYSPAARESLKTGVPQIEESCRKGGLPLMAPVCQRLLQVLDRGSDDDIQRLIHDLHTRLEDALTESLFMQFLPSQAGLYQQPLHGWDQTAVSFPSTIIDIDEAAKCLACDRGTACVFHLMRVLEIGLRSLARELGIPYAPSWEAYLRQITVKIDKKHRRKGIRWKRDELFFRDVAAHMSTLKVAWRNPTMHVATTHTVEDAENIFNATRTFMEYLAKRLADEPQQKHGDVKPATVH
ncbi:MAG: hypothetical protein LAO77_15935 [Acidobacteriia bacterium]|nr:hypothetical protein [Terriglobia bacterium]